MDFMGRKDLNGSIKIGRSGISCHYILTFSYLILIFREHGESQEVEIFYGVNGDFAYKLGLADYTIEPMMSTDREPREPCILVCQKRTLELNGGSLDAEELRKIESQLTD